MTLLAAMTGCGGSTASLCGDLHALAQKDLGPCGAGVISQAEFFALGQVGTNEGACNSNMQSCSDADQQAIRRFVDCVNAAPQCASDEQSYDGAISACGAANHVSSACKEVEK